MAESSCLIVASHFPPVQGVGVHRPVALCRHLVARAQAEPLAWGSRKGLEDRGDEK